MFRKLSNSKGFTNLQCLPWRPLNRRPGLATFNPLPSHCSTFLGYISTKGRFSYRYVGGYGGRYVRPLCTAIIRHGWCQTTTVLCLEFFSPQRFCQDSTSTCCEKECMNEERTYVCVVRMCQWPCLLGNLVSSHHQTITMASTRQRKKSSHRSRHMLIHFHDNGVVCPSSFGQTCPEDGQWDGGKEGKRTSFCADKNTYLMSRDGASNQIL